MLLLLYYSVNFYYRNNVCEFIKKWIINRQYSNQLTNIAWINPVQEYLQCSVPYVLFNDGSATFQFTKNNDRFQKGVNLFSLGLKCHTFIGLNMSRDCRRYFYVRLMEMIFRNMADASPTYLDISNYLINKLYSV